MISSVMLAANASSATSALKFSNGTTTMRGHSVRCGSLELRERALRLPQLRLLPSDDAARADEQRAETEREAPPRERAWRDLRGAAPAPAAALLVAVHAKRYSTA